ncbi:MAG: hypothetical protein JW946_03570, partial [Candidatus Omnitrophica bacterium]|nr:hypothetical protein [Candidatus Omnitrophota bacterium]
EWVYRHWNKWPKFKSWCFFESNNFDIRERTLKQHFGSKETLARLEAIRNKHIKREVAIIVNTALPHEQRMEALKNLYRGYFSRGNTEVVLMLSNPIAIKAVFYCKFARLFFTLDEIIRMLKALPKNSANRQLIACARGKIREFRRQERDIDAAIPIIQSVPQQLRNKNIDLNMTSAA